MRREERVTVQGPRKETTTRRNVTQGASTSPPPPPSNSSQVGELRCEAMVLLRSHQKTVSRKTVEVMEDALIEEECALAESLERVESSLSSTMGASPGGSFLDLVDDGTPRWLRKRVSFMVDDAPSAPVTPLSRSASQRQRASPEPVSPVNDHRVPRWLRRRAPSQRSRASSLSAFSLGTSPPPASQLDDSVPVVEEFPDPTDHVEYIEAMLYDLGITRTVSI